MDPLIRNSIKGMAQDSPELLEVYHEVFTKFWQGTEWAGALVQQLFHELTTLREVKACHGQFQVDDETYFFDFYTHKTELAKLAQAVVETVQEDVRKKNGISEMDIN